MPAEGVRLDAALVERGLASGREKAKAYIRGGQVTVNGRTETKPSLPVSAADAVDCAAREPFVGRGGYKLEKALAVFGISLEGAVALDVGASTGGFTDCALRRGARAVYAVDVGHGQLHPALAADGRVHSLEGCDIRDEALRERIPEGTADFCSIDVSFISAAKIAGALIRYLRPGASVVCLVKPQFEAGRAAVGKRGLVGDPAAHAAAIRQVAGAFAAHGCRAFDLTWSPMTGGSGADGNLEYLLGMLYNGNSTHEAQTERNRPEGLPDDRVWDAVAGAFRELKGVDVCASR